MTKKVLSSALFLVLMLAALTGCVPASFNKSKAQSEPIIKELQTNFNLDGFSKKAISGGSFSFESGGDPNLGFIARRSGTADQIANTCVLVDGYVRKISSTKPTFFPRLGVVEKTAVSTCLGELLSYQHDGFRWNGTYRNVPISVVLDSSPFSNLGASATVALVFQLEVSTNIEDGKMGLVEAAQGNEIVGTPQSITTYLDTIQDYRQKHGFTFFTEKLIGASGAIAKTNSETLTPIVDASGLVTRLRMHRFDSGSKDTYDTCYSLLPWDRNVWGIEDPGKPRPLMSVQALADLHSFGQYVSRSNCLVDDSK